jgi:hypothetical protein
MPPMAAASVSNPKTRRNPKTSTDLWGALSAPNDTMTFLESIMDPYYALAPVTNSSNKGADLHYGPGGPQRRDKLQLRSATLALFFHGRRESREGVLDASKRQPAQIPRQKREATNSEVSPLYLLLLTSSVPA